ncbi:putative nucleotide-binding protein [Microbacterium sp. ZKA21]|uniref:TIR domain-containing protein n=1 Tax=Microbacterium sp. ZKA21 TaxID=3381694 RepID=UPI003D1BA49F
MARISMSIPGAVITAEIVRDLRDALRPFTLRESEEWLEADDEPGENDVYSVKDIYNYKVSAREEIDRGGTISLAEFTVTSADGVEYHWEEDDGAPLEYLADALNAHVVLDNSSAFLRVEISIDPFQARVVIDNAYGLFISRADRTGFEITRIADIVKKLIPERAVPLHIAPQLQPFRVFIGHGGDRKWEAVREFIREAGYAVEAFETSPRAGQMTLAVVERMISDATVAVIVMTGADALADGRKMARQNVVHELGFAQGRLGVDNTIVLLEDGTEEFTNIAGLTQIRFNNGEIHTTKDHVLAALANKVRDRAG